MSTLTLELPPRAEQTAFNLRRWDEVLANPEWQKVSGRVETDRHGRVVINPIAPPQHGRLQADVAIGLGELMKQGEVLVECPVSTADGVKGVDAAWASPECWGEVGNRAFFIRSPEICVEVISPSNSEEEIREKMAIYFDAGAKEVWVCGIFGAMRFHKSSLVALSRSELCPNFPSEV